MSRQPKSKTEYVPVKWRIAEALNKDGYDMMTALEIANTWIKEFLASGKQSEERSTKTQTFRLERKAR